jgi:DNA-binding CsgD family transcriptional regulator
VRRGPRTVLWSQLRAVEAVGFHHLVHRDPLRAVDAFDIAGHLASAAEISNPAFTEWRVGASIAWSMRGEPARGRVLAEQSLELAERFGGAPIVERSLRALALAVDGTERVDLLRRAADMMEDHPFALVRCMVFLDLGAALAAIGDVDDAVEWLRRGGDLAVQLGAHALMDRAHDRLLQAGARPRRLARSGVASLTRSELRVAALAAEGRTNSAIAAQLYVSLKTVESHLGKVYRKMQVSGRSELMECWSAEAARVARQRTE